MRDRVGVEGERKRKGERVREREKEWGRVRERWREVEGNRA